MDAGTIVGIVAGLVVVWALLIGVLWILRPRDVGLRDLVAVAPDVLRFVRNLLAEARYPSGFASRSAASSSGS